VGSVERAGRMAVVLERRHMRPGRRRSLWLSRRPWRRRRLRILARDRLRSARLQRPRGPPRNAAPSGQLPETVLRNVALEAVRLGNYYAEDQDEVLRYIAEVHAGLLEDTRWLAKRPKMKLENGLTRLYSVEEILAKKHEADGFNVFVDPDEAVAAKEAEALKASNPGGPADLEPGVLAEMQEGITSVVAAAEGSGTPIDDDEIVELLEGCAKAGEVGAAVFCGERLEAIHGTLPEPLLARAFAALKPLLRPSAARARPQLEGPWARSQSGRAGAPNVRRQLGQLLMRFAQARKQLEVAEGGATAERAARIAEAEAVLSRLCAALLPALAADPEAGACARRGRLAQLVARLCQERGLEVSAALALQVTQELERSGAVVSRGRTLELVNTAAGSAAGHPPSGGLGIEAKDLELLEELAKERLDRRKRRQKARDRGRVAKRRRMDD